ncbi:MAG: type II toxin-antitoxin system Phd/YefM family antitoxin [Betaproteobacteria bacterium]|nr:type II toxin-antitoxin system Phd/YefM family antitoxin [Betaproteobacteria bacterium]
MKTISARDAKTRFGELLDTMQREPVVVTKNNRPVGIMISIKDASDTLIPELFMEKEEGYDNWFKAKVTKSLKAVKAGTTALTKHDQAMDRAWARALARAKTAPA